MLGFLPRQESLRETTRSVIARLAPLYQTCTRPENKYPSLLSLAVGASFYLSGFGWLSILWSMAASLMGGHFGLRATQEAIVFYNRVKDIADHIDVTVINANNHIVQLSQNINARVTEAEETIAATNALLGRANAQIDPAFENLHRTVSNLNETLRVVRSTAEYLDGGAQVTSTMLTPLSFTARALRATGNYLRGTNDAVPAAESPAEGESREKEALSQSGDCFPY